MFDINQLKHKIQHGGIALSEALEQRVLNDQLTENDYEFLKRAFGDMRDLTKKIKNGEPIPAYEEE